MNIPVIERTLFFGKNNIPWNDVEKYLKKYIGRTYVVREYQDKINIPGDFPNEYAESRYTKKLRGALAKVKANAAQIIDQLIVNATNRRWVENKEIKHKENASGGWYRYDTYFAVLVKSSNEESERMNHYKATVIVRITSKGLFLYDIVDIKKERVRRLSPEEPYGKKPLLL